MANLDKSVLITGANSGIGLEFTIQYLKADYQVFCCCLDLDDCEELKKMTKRYPYLKLYQTDVTNPQHLEALEGELEGIPIDILINNAGTFGLHDEFLSDLSTDNLLDVYRTNTIAPLKMIESLIPSLCRGTEKKVVTITSYMASISQNVAGGAYAYRGSKAALNAVMRSAAIDLEELGIKVLLLHPGWVKTKMGTHEATLTPEESVGGMMEVIEAYDGSQLAPFLNYQGKTIPW